jgi:hypothetical protein
MLEKDLIEQLTQLQEIKPNKDWAHWLLSNILIKSHQEVMMKPRVKLVSFSFIHQYQKALVSSAFVILFISTFVFAQTTLPGNPLYPVKTLTQNARIALTPKDHKPVIRMQIAKNRLEDMAKVFDQEEKVALMAQNIKQDLNIIPEELKNISKKQVALQMSKQVQDEAKDLNNIISKTQLQSQDKDSLNQTVQDTQSQVLGLIIDTQEEIDNCPSDLKDKLANLQKYFTDNVQTLVQWPIDDITKVRTFLGDIDNDIKAGNCLEARAKIDSINQILQIHSLDIKVETSTPEN